MSGLFYSIFNPGNWWFYILCIIALVWLFKKPNRNAKYVNDKIKTLEENAKRADEVLFERIEQLEKQLDILNQRLETEPAEHEKTIRNLKDRIEVLEAIVTDRRYDLDKKISGL